MSPTHESRRGQAASGRARFPRSASRRVDRWLRRCLEPPAGGSAPSLADREVDPRERRPLGARSRALRDDPPLGDLRGEPQLDATDRTVPSTNGPFRSCKALPRQPRNRAAIEVDAHRSRRRHGDRAHLLAPGAGALPDNGRSRAGIRGECHKALIRELSSVRVAIRVASDAERAGSHRAPAGVERLGEAELMLAQEGEAAKPPVREARSS
jgi:hypothetical protein